MFVDSHCHLDYEGISREDIPNIMSRARTAGVGLVVTIGISKPTFSHTIEITESDPDIFCCIGVHPHDAEKEGQEITAQELVSLSQHPKVIGLGETGLDYYYDHAPREAQQRSFREHIRACIQTGLPLVIHTREAEEDTIRILQEERKGHEAELCGVFHCFSSKRELAEYALEIGFYISLSGMLTFKKSQEIRDIAQDVPLDSLLLETDSPFLAPIPFRGKRCEPSYVIHTAKCLADIKNVSVKEVEDYTTRNFLNLFKKVGIA